MSIAKQTQLILEQIRAQAVDYPLAVLSEYIAGKRITKEGKTLMQCFEKDATPLDRAKGTHLMQSYMEKYTTALPSLIDRAKGDNGKLSFQAMQVSTDFPLWTTSGNGVVMNLDDVDTGWVRAFRELRIDEGKKYAEFGEGNHNLEFYDMEEGQNYRGNDLSADKYSLSVMKRGLQYLITDETMLFNDFAANLDLSAAMMNAYAKKMQSIHYGVIADSAVSNVANLVAWVAGSNTLERDIKTINAQADYLYGALRNKISNASTAPFLLYVNGNDSFVSRIKQALSAVSPNLQTGYQVTSRKIEVIPTSNLATSAGVAVATTRTEMVYPGRLLVRATKRDLMMERYRDATKDINITKANFYCGADTADITQTVFGDFA
jgi:hypothetical protein